MDLLLGVTHPASAVSSPMAAPPPAKAIPVTPCAKEFAVATMIIPTMSRMDPKSEMFLLPNMSCRWPQNGQTAARANEFATVSHPVEAAPRSTAM